MSATMQPNDVPEDLYDRALDALPGEPDDVISATTQDEVRAALAAVLPEYEKRIRAKVAAEIEATVPRGRRPTFEPHRYLSDAAWAARVARGEA